MAARNKALDEFDEYSYIGNELAPSRDHFGFTPLHWCCLNDDVASLESILKRHSSAGIELGLGPKGQRSVPKVLARKRSDAVGHRATGPGGFTRQWRRRKTTESNSSRACVKSTRSVCSIMWLDKSAQLSQMKKYSIWDNAMSMKLATLLCRWMGNLRQQECCSSGASLISTNVTKGYTLLQKCADNSLFLIFYFSKYFSFFFKKVSVL